MANEWDIEAAAGTAAKAAKSAHRAMVLTAFAVAVAVLVLAIDNSIKRSIVAEAQQVRAIFREFQEATDGLKAAIEEPAGDRVVDSPGDDGSSDMAKPARARTATGSHADAGTPAGASGKGSPRARP